MHESTIDTSEPQRRWGILAVLGAAQLLGMSLWFSASATSAQLAALWNLDASGAASLTTAVQMGFVAGTAIAAILTIADAIPARIYLPVSAVLAAAANAALVLADSPATTLVSRFFTGFFLAGVYPPAMKMAATWFRASRGVAIGVIVGALTLGKATPYLVGGLHYQVVALATSAAALVAAVLVALAYRDGPFPFPKRPFSFGLAGTIARDRPTRLALGGYLGHMWELYACWTLIGLFFADVFRLHGSTPAAATAAGGLVAFAAIAAGSVGSVAAGVWADRFGRERITIWAMAISGLCSLSIGWMRAAPVPLLVAIAIVWGFAVVADSAQFSALITEVAPAHAVGTALTLQTSLGFLLTAFSIWLAAFLSTRYGWGVAFAMLAIGPALGIRSMVLLRRTRKLV